MVALLNMPYPILALTLTVANAGHVVMGHVPLLVPITRLPPMTNLAPSSSLILHVLILMDVFFTLTPPFLTQMPSILLQILTLALSSLALMTLPFTLP